MKSIDERRAAELAVAVERAEDEAAWEHLKKLFVAALDVVDRKDLCYRLDLQSSQLSDAIAERGKHIQLRWLRAVADLLPPGPLAKALAAELAEYFGFGVVDLPDPDAQTELQELAAAVEEEFGLQGRALVARRRKVRRRARKAARHA